MKRPGLKKRDILFVLALSSLLLVIVKLFTYEFYLPDDPTCGIALRAEPMLESRMPLRGAARIRTDHVLVHDENDFLGAGLYRFIVSVGWIVMPLCALLIAGAFCARDLQERF